MFGVKRGITSKTGGLYGERMLFYFMHYRPQLANLPIIPLKKWLTIVPILLRHTAPPPHI